MELFESKDWSGKVEELIEDIETKLREARKKKVGKDGDKSTKTDISTIKKQVTETAQGFKEAQETLKTNAVAAESPPTTV